MPVHMLKIAAWALVALALVACERKKAAPASPATGPQPVASAPTGPQGFQHDPAFDVQGFFVPTSPVRVGTMNLRHVAFGAPSDFKSWEAGARDAAFGPILLDFTDDSRPAAGNAAPDEAQSGSIQVLPAGYRISPGAITFRATDPKLGDIAFNGAIDATALAALRAAGSGDGRVAMTGTLRLGEATFEKVAFTYVMGD